MSKSKFAENILKHLQKDQPLICHLFGTSRPILDDIKGKKFIIYAKNRDIVLYILELMKYTIHNNILTKFPRKKKTTCLKMLARSRWFIHVCRLLSYIINITFVPEDGCADRLKTCAKILTDCIHYSFCKVMNISKKCLHKMIIYSNTKPSFKKNFYKPVYKLSHTLDHYILKNHNKLLQKINNLICINHSRHVCLYAKSRLTLLHKPLTQFKYKINKLTNKLVTTRMKSGENEKSIHDNISCPVNFVHQAAIITSCFEKIEQLSNADLQSFLSSKLSVELPLDVDLYYVLGGLIDAARNRLKTKVLEVNSNRCTCHAKCTGYDLKGAIKQELECDGLKRDTMISYCSRCMLSPVVWNTKFRRSHLKICANNPSLQICSQDNNVMFTDASLYSAEYEGFGRYRYQHLFYSTNDISIIEELCGKKCTGPATELYGLCYGGDRLCLQMPRSEIASSRKEKTLRIDRNILFRCY